MKKIIIALLLVLLTADIAYTQTVGGWSSGSGVSAYTDVTTLWASGSCTGLLNDDGTCKAIGTDVQEFDTALSSLASKVFAKTALTGAGGLDTVLYADIADGDIGYVGTIAGVWYVFIFEASSSTAESSPNVITPDDAGANNGRWLLKLYCDGSSCTVPQATTGAYSTLLEGSGNGTNFRRRSVPDALTADLNERYPNAVPTIDQIKVWPAPTDGVSAFSYKNYGYIKQYNADTLSDTSTPHGLIAVEVSGTIINNYDSSAEAKEFDLPAAAAEYNFTLIIGTAQNVTIDPNGSDVIYLQTPDHALAALAAGEAVVNAGPTVGESITCFTFQTGASSWAWKCVSDCDDFNEESP